MTRHIPQSNTHPRPSRRRHPATLIGAVLAGAATALLSGCAFEPYPPLPIPPQPAGTIYGGYSALPGPVEVQGPVHRFAEESEGQPDAQPVGQPPMPREPWAGARPVAGAPARTPVQPEAWRGDPAAFVGPPRPGPRKLTIRLKSQRFEYSEGGNILHTGQVTTGSAEHPTPKGSYRILGKERDKRSGSYTNYFDMPTPMPYALQFTGPYYVHEGWIADQAESHGCVRLHYEDARFVYERMKVGDRIAVVD
jgi:lipoprotein-anchoring transpeptidase ErfK/SrfK